MVEVGVGAGHVKCDHAIVRLTAESITAFDKFTAASGKKFMRVSTSMKKENAKRAVGTQFVKSRLPARR